ncbi:MAG: hypothetical protein WAV72_05665, partial [Bradyrhizobium sp.]
FADEFRRTEFFTACIDVARRALPAPVLVWLRSQMVRNLSGGPREVFTEFYRRNICKTTSHALFRLTNMWDNAIHTST